MSLINQVLKDLDKRGANTNIGEATIRVVHEQSRLNAFWFVTAGAIGMLVLATAGWFLWQSQVRSVVTQNTGTIAPPQPVVRASQPVVAPAQKSLPRIDNISPEPLIASGHPQKIIINGSNFEPGDIVNLRGESDRLYADRPIQTLTPNQIVLNLNFGKTARTWVLEVLGNDGKSSGPYTFAVNAAIVAVLPDQSADRVEANTKNRKADEPAFIAIPKNTTLKHHKQATTLNYPGVVMAEGVSKQPTQISTQQQAENEFRRAFQLMREGRNTEAFAGFEAALQLDPSHDQARQSIVGLLLEKKRNTEAEHVLQGGLKNNEKQTAFAILLARLQVERNALPEALETLMHGLPYAEKQADYQAFVAALLQRQNRHGEAVNFYQKALQLKPHAGVWLMGMGISMRAMQQNIEARQAFKSALDSNSLSTELQAYVTQQLKEL